jgi:hypothetical protein
VSALAGYRLNRCFSLVAGYKALCIDYTRHDTAMDTTMAGPITALVYQTRF